MKNENVDVMELYHLHLTNKKPIQNESIKVYTIKEKRLYWDMQNIENNVDYMKIDNRNLDSLFHFFSLLK